MPLPLAPLIMAGSALAGGALNNISQGSQNRRSRRFAVEQYNRERDDNVAFWRQQNSYNDPSAQISRLKKAGLNPALMYGGSASGASGTAGPLKAPSSQRPQFQSSNPGDAVAGAGLSFMNGLYDLELKKAQTNNLKSQNDVIIQDASLRAAQTANTLQGTEKSKFDLGLASELRSVSADAARENLRTMRVNNDVNLASNERAAAANASSLSEAAERILSLRAQRANTHEQRAQIRQATANLKKDGTLKQFDIELRELGINPGSPWWSQIVGRLLSNLLKDGLPSSSSPASGLYPIKKAFKPGASRMLDSLRNH